MRAIGRPADELLDVARAAADVSIGRAGRALLRDLELKASLKRAFKVPAAPKALACRAML